MHARLEFELDSMGGKIVVKIFLDEIAPAGNWRYFIILTVSGQGQVLGLY